MKANEQLLWLNEVCLSDIAKVGGKNASLGEMLRHLTAKGIRVPEGFAITTNAFREFVEHNHLKKKIEGDTPRVRPRQPGPGRRAGREGEDGVPRRPSSPMN